METDAVGGCEPNVVVKEAEAGWGDWVGFSESRYHGDIDELLLKRHQQCHPRHHQSANSVQQRAHVGHHDWCPSFLCSSSHYFLSLYRRLHMYLSCLYSMLKLVSGSISVRGETILVSFSIFFFFPQRQKSIASYFLKMIFSMSHSPSFKTKSTQYYSYKYLIRL